MTPLSRSDFAPFLEAVHGHPPFPWQERLLNEVVDHGWPAVLDLPTGSGKTTALDVAVFHLALDAARPPAERTAPRRVVYVVDRRVVVDQAHQHAEALREALARPEDLKGASSAQRAAVAAVAERLRALTGPLAEGGTGGLPSPLATTILRGAMVRDESWAKSADQPTVVVSTVDQVGSRLLFRGYGVSEGMRPVHAGLLGQDTLFVLDEVHLSQPFAETLARLERHSGALGGLVEGLPRRWGVVALSATPRDQGGAVFGLGADDRAHGVLSKRLAAKKHAALAKVSVPKDSSHPLKAFGEAAAERAYKHLGANRIQVLGLLLNRVDSARAAAKKLQADHGEAVEVVLLTGRMRPLDRDDRLNARSDERPSLLARLMDRGARRADDRPLILVSTQAIEAGADFDLDALVTECASLDALKQRFGRVDRKGTLAETRSLILRRSGDGKDDPIYGGALDATWKLLEAVGGKQGVDFGLEALPTLLVGHALGECLPEATPAPDLRPADLEAWARTRPAPSADPEPSLFLHGLEEIRPEVQVVWRTEVAALAGGQPDRDALVAALEACPPSSLEAMSLPLGAVRAWLARAPASEVADVEGRSAQAGAEDVGERGGARQVLRWRGEDSDLIPARRLRPGDTVVVPPSYGGLWAGNWDPEAQQDDRAPIPDWGDRAQWVHRRRASLRLDPAARAAWGLSRTPPPPEAKDDPAADQQALTGWLELLRNDRELPEWVNAAAALLADTRHRKVLVPADSRVLQAGAAARKGPSVGVADLVADETTSAFTDGAVPLDRHLEAVGAEAGRLARSLGLSDPLAADVALAGRLHDLGKADPRFQQMLYGGSEADFLIAGVHLAKSGLPAGDRAARLAARRAAGWPQGLRHELTSVALAEASGFLDEANDPELVAHLIAAHHGHARPLAPPVADPAPVTVAWRFDARPVAGTTDHGLWRLDSPLPGRFERLTDRYGWYGLAWLETLVRLADQRVSAAQAGEAA